jgi:effector-binding domain-containing protein
MLERPHVTQATAQLTAVIPLTIPRERIREVMGPGISEVMATLAAQGIAPAGPWLTYHRRMDPKVFDFEIAVPVGKRVAESGRVRPGELPAARVARAVHVGGYEGLGAAWGEFEAWIAANGHEPRGDMWERYVAGPESGPDPAKWRTELNRPLRA